MIRTLACVPTGFVHLFKGSVRYKFDLNAKHVVSTGPANDLLECKRPNGGEMSSEAITEGHI